MPKQQKGEPGRIQPTYQLIPVLGPSEGVDLRQSPTLLAAGRARTLINWSLDEPGALVVRSGWKQFSTSATLGGGRLQGAGRIYFQTAVPSAVSTIVTVVASSQQLYTISDTGTFSSTNQSGLSTREIYFPSDRDLVVAMDGSTLLRKSTNGSSWTRFGIVRPSTGGPGVSSLSTGGLSSGEYEINWTYKDRDLAFESNGSSKASTITITGTSGAVSVVMTNSTDPQVEAVVVYARHVSNGETVRRKVSSLAQSAGSTTTYVVTSTAWGTNAEEPTDHDHPSYGLTFGVVWKNRWWARDQTVTNRLRFTQLFQPQGWPSNFYIDLPFERGDQIQALQQFGDALIVFGDTRPFLIIGQTSLDFEVRPALGGQDGAFGPRAVCLIEGGVVHAGAAGIWVFDGPIDKLLSYDLEPAWRDMVDNATSDQLSRIACVYHQRKKELRVAVPRRYPSGVPGEWVLDLARSRGETTAWLATDRDVAGYVHWNGPETVAGNRGRLFSWPSTSGIVNEESSTSFAANGSNMTAEYEGPGLTLGPYKGRWVDMRGEYEPHGGALTAQAVIDGVSMPSQSLTIGAGLAKYGTAVYGTDSYPGAGRRQFHTMLPANAEGRTYVQKFTYRGTEQFRLYSYHLGMIPEPASRNFTE